MRTRQLKPGMRIDHPVADRLGRILVARGATLDEYIIDAMLKMGGRHLYAQPVLQQIQHIQKCQGIYAAGAGSQYQRPCWQRYIFLPVFLKSFQYIHH